MHLSPVLQEFDLGFQVYLKTLFYSSLNFPNHVFYINFSADGIEDGCLLMQEQMLQMFRLHE